MKGSSSLRLLAWTSRTSRIPLTGCSRRRQSAHSSCGEHRAACRRRLQELEVSVLHDAVFSLCGVLLITLACGGCVTKSTAKAQARQAYIAGQQEALMRLQQAQMQGQGPCVTVNGEVRNRVVPWTEGMTLAKALLVADYYGTADPGQIIVVHNGVATRVELKQLLAGADIPLQPGDIVQLMPQAGAPR